ncbi:MAG TPA: type II toxin-antitoxin system VapC family toxin [Rhizobiaceae bacterium]|nr:type II toxin-antitoxin system VapC family toxin [Rhizobiaceae bacterium]
MIYVDTSVMVAAIIPEQASERVRGWLEKQSADDLSVSDWTVTEFSSALSIKMRSGRLAIDDRNTVLEAFSRIVEESFERFRVERADFTAAARFAERHDLGLRAGDALHVAIAIANGTRLATLDKTLAKAATAAGVNCILLK